MRFLSGHFLAGDGVGQTAEFFQGALELLFDLFALRLIHSFQFCGRGFQSTVGPASDSRDRLQIPEHLLDCTVSRGWWRSLALRL
jgi:hypothetical protein